MTIAKTLLVIILVIYMISKFIPAKGVNNITMDELTNELKSNNNQLIDVRTRGEYRIEHLEGSINIPLRRLHKQVDDLEKDKETIVVCQTGIRSMQACKKLKKLGFDNLTNVQGGMTSKN